jgi:hypothetical protein
MNTVVKPGNKFPLQKYNLIRLLRGGACGQCVSLLYQYTMIK